MSRLLLLLAALCCAALCCAAQEKKPLTLADAEALALRNHPRIAGAKLQAQAARETIIQTRAAMQPFAAVNLTAAGADHATVLGTGTVQTSSLASRTAGGFAASQTLFDFGRNAALTDSFKLRADAQSATVNVISAEILVRVREAYFRALSMQAQRGLAEQIVAARRVTLKQIAALVNSSLRSTLDLSFAELNVSEAEIFLDQAENRHRAAIVELAAAMGADQTVAYELKEESDPSALADSADPLVKTAFDQRPELANARLTVQAARRFAESERRLIFPTLSASAVAGYYGPHDPRLLPRYAGASLNLNIPIFNGSQFASRRREADLRADAAEKDVKDLEIRIGREVRTAWLDADTARRRLTLTARHLEQARKTLRLAKTRYDAGLGTIVELTQSQLNETTAEVGAVTARYEYLYRRALLDFFTGSNR